MKIVRRLHWRRKRTFADSVHSPAAGLTLFFGRLMGSRVPCSSSFNENSHSMLRTSSPPALGLATFDRIKNGFLRWNIDSVMIDDDSSNSRSPRWVCILRWTQRQRWSLSLHAKSFYQRKTKQINASNEYTATAAALHHVISKIRNLNALELRNLSIRRIACINDFPSQFRIFFALRRALILYYCVMFYVHRNRHRCCCCCWRCFAQCSVSLFVFPITKTSCFFRLGWSEFCEMPNEPTVDRWRLS